MKYAITIKATIIKTIEVDADDLSQANDLAHEEFTVANNDNDEKYEQETIAECEVQS